MYANDFGSHFEVAGMANLQNRAYATQKTDRLGIA